MGVYVQRYVRVYKNKCCEQDASGQANHPVVAVLSPVAENIQTIKTSKNFRLDKVMEARNH